jgi:precorrin-2/cobalt-factor-2 C20-methyltransferase
LKLIAVGVGPGDPDLITIGALRALDEADVVLLPISAPGRESAAGGIYSKSGGRDRETHKFWFPMINDEEERDRQIKRQREELRPVWERADTAALPVIGDSALYATASYLYSVWSEICPGLELRLLPGISAHSLASGASGEFLATGDERLSILPGSADPEKLEKSMSESDCVALYKPSALGEKLTALVESTGPWNKAVRVHRAGFEDQSIETGPDAISPTNDYLSVLLLWRHR